MTSFECLTPTHVLIVEDDALVQLELAAWMTELGLMPTTADNADEALKLLNSGAPIEILLTDVEMPGSMNGVALAKRVAEHWPPIKIVVLSGASATELSDLPQGSAFVAKPFDHSKLWQALSRSSARH